MEKSTILIGGVEIARQRAENLMIDIRETHKMACIAGPLLAHALEPLIARAAEIKLELAQIKNCLEG